MGTSPTEVLLISPKELLIKWSDGKECLYPLEHLRRSCPCASCRSMVEEFQEKGIPFLLNSHQVELKSVVPVGSYALQLVWGDGHDTGIYSYEYLHQLCTH